MSFRILIGWDDAVSRKLTKCFDERKGAVPSGSKRAMSRCMAEIRIERAHTLGKDGAMAAALRVAERMKEKAQINYRVVGDAVEFERTGASGRIVVEAERIVAEIKL